MAVSERLDVSLLAQSGSGNRCDGRKRKTVCLQVGAVIYMCLAVWWADIFLLRSIHTVRQRQRCDNAAMMLAILS